MGKQRDKKQEPKAEKKRRHEGASNLAREARLAGGQGERAWSKWPLKDVAEEVRRLNHDITPELLASVRSRDYVKVKLLKRGKDHKVFPQQDESLGNKRVPYFGLKEKKVRKLTPDDVKDWAKHLPSKKRIAEAVANLTGRDE